MIYTDGICSELGCYGGIKDITVGKVGLEFFSFLNLENLIGSAHKLQVWHLLCLRMSGDKNGNAELNRSRDFLQYLCLNGFERQLSVKRWLLLPVHCYQIGNYGWILVRIFNF